MIPISGSIETIVAPFTVMRGGLAAICSDHGQRQVSRSLLQNPIKGLVFLIAIIVATLINLRDEQAA